MTSKRPVSEFRTKSRQHTRVTRVGGLLGATTVVILLNAVPSTGAPAGPEGMWKAAAFEASESVRMIRAKDLISDEQWIAAIAELRAAVADEKEGNRDEALFWLAHSQNQVGDLAEAVESIWKLQREFQKSRWSGPAYSLLIELAQKLGRQDVLWRMAPPPPPPPPRPGVTPRAAPAAQSPRTPPAPPSASSVATPLPPPPPAPPAAVPASEPVSHWVSESFLPDTDLRIQALGRLIHTDANKVIPMLGNIALEEDNPGAARRAVFVLAQSRHPKARSVVFDVAKKGPEAVRVAAVRELGRFGGPDVAQELLLVYSDANVRVKQQVVMSLGLRAETKALSTIAQSESNPELRETAVIALGRAGGREQLRVMYAKTSLGTRRAIIRALFTARDDDGLIQIAEQEKEPGLRAYVRERLRLMGTTEAKAYLAKNKEQPR